MYQVLQRYHHQIQKVRLSWQFTYKIKIVQPCVLQALIDGPLHAFGVVPADRGQNSPYTAKGTEETDLRELRGNEEFFSGNPRSLDCLSDRFLCSVNPCRVNVSVACLQSGENPRSRFCLFNGIFANKNPKTYIVMNACMSKHPPTRAGLTHNGNLGPCVQGQRFR
jgi:hypothetical protein